MAKIPFVAGFKDPARRPRYIIWTGVGVLALAVVVIVALGVTSTYWFCANGCHKVQDDTIAAYQASSHNKVSCMACHMPVNADPVSFLLHKAEALGELYLTATNNFEIPLNAESHVAFEMSSGQCTQCHSMNRVYTPSSGILIDHDVHAEKDVSCTLCHNRVAHADGDIEFVNVDPTTNELNYPHDNFMTMTACFRCHSQEPDAEAPGACEACHTPEFELKPGNHFEPGFYELGGDSAGHAELAQEAWGETSATPEAQPVSDESDGHGAEPAFDLAPLDEIFYCGTCHSSAFCEDCHGLPMPHPADFAEGHGEAGKADSAVCANCHAKGEAVGSSGTEFCNSCHHPEGDATRPWIPQHFEAVRQSGAQACFECHNPTFCAECHVRGSR